MQWTKAYLGHEHIRKPHAAITQVTLVDHGDEFVEVYAIGTGTFSSIWHEIHKTVPEAKAAAAKFLIPFGITSIN